MTKKIILLLVFASLLFAYAPEVHAHCPLCTAAVGTAAISAKYYGMDTSIIGLFIGAFGISTGLWIGRKIKKQYIKFQLPIVVLLSFVLTVIPLMSVDNSTIYAPVLLLGPAGSVLNKVYWINKILFGSIIGGAASLLGFWLHTYIKKVRGSVLFPYQGIAITLTLLGAGTLALYFGFKV